MSVTRESTVVIISLSAALILSNAFWLHRILDVGVSFTYTEDSLRHARSTAVQALGLLPEVSRPGASRASIVAAALRSRPGVETFEKDGFLWIDDIGLKFDSDGRLVEARPAVDPF